MLSLIALASLAIGLFIGFKIGVWWTKSVTRKAASAVKNTAQGSWNGAKGLFKKAKDMLSGDKPKNPKDDKEKP